MDILPPKRSPYTLPSYIEFLGGERREFWDRYPQLALNSIDVMVKESQDAIDIGYKILKIKVGEDTIETLRG